MKRASLMMGMMLLLMTGVVGCGGGGETTITKGEFTRQAEAICSKAVKDKEAAVTAAVKSYEDFGQKTKAQEKQQLTALVTNGVLPALSKLSDELDELGAPEGNPADAEAMVEAFRDAATEIEENPGQAAEGKTNPFDDSSRLAREYGLKACADF